MSSITTINGSDQISTSRTVINTNFSNLNTDKMETSVLDTDTTLTANSDAKVATQKAVKTYVDAVVSPVGKSWNEYAASSNGTDSYAITLTGVTAYVVGQVYKFRADVANTGSASVNVNGLGAKTIKKNSTSDLVTGDIVAGQIVVVTYDSSGNMQLVSNSSLSQVKFGGTGADGALSITSGTTTVNLGGARVYVLNYSSISITGTGKLAFSSPHANGTVVIIKCQGNCTLTSSAAPMIDLTNCGATVGTGGSQGSIGGSANGSDGTDGITYGFLKTNKGAGSTGSATGGAVGTFAYPLVSGNINDLIQICMKYPHLFLGAGGGGARSSWSAGGSGTVVGGDGGRGGGCLIMEIGGAMNFTTAGGISVGGSNGTAGSITGNPSIYHAGGGGGGGGGCAFIFYNTLTAFSGTVTVSGGTGGNTKVGGALNAGNGGAGGGSAFSAGGNNTGSTTSDGVTSGGAGGNGFELHALNTEYT